MNLVDYRYTNGALNPRLGVSPVGLLQDAHLLVPLQVLDPVPYPRRERAILQTHQRLHVLHDVLGRVLRRGVHVAVQDGLVLAPCVPRVVPDVVDAFGLGVRDSYRAGLVPVGSKGVDGGVTVSAEISLGFY